TQNQREQPDHNAEKAPKGWGVWDGRQSSPIFPNDEAGEKGNKKSMGEVRIHPPVPNQRYENRNVEPCDQRHENQSLPVSDPLEERPIGSGWWKRGELSDIAHDSVTRNSLKSGQPTRKLQFKCRVPNQQASFLSGSSQPKIGHLQAPVSADLRIACSQLTSNLDSNFVD